MAKSILLILHQTLESWIAVQIFEINLSSSIDITFVNFLGIACLTLIFCGHLAVTLNPRALLWQIAVLGPVSGAPIGCFATVSSCRAGSESWGGVERSSQICVHVCMRSRRLGGTSEFLGHLSAAGFEPTRCCLKWILSPPP